MDLRWLTLLLAVLTVLRHDALALPPPLSAFHAFTVCDLEAHVEVTSQHFGHYSQRLDHSGFLLGPFLFSSFYHHTKALTQMCPFMLRTVFLCGRGQLPWMDLIYHAPQLVQCLRDVLRMRRLTEPAVTAAARYERWITCAWGALQTWGACPSCVELQRDLTTYMASQLARSASAAPAQLALSPPRPARVAAEHLGSPSPRTVSRFLDYGPPDEPLSLADSPFSKRYKQWYGAQTRQWCTATGRVVSVDISDEEPVPDVPTSHAASSSSTPPPRPGPSAADPIEDAM